MKTKKQYKTEEIEKYPKKCFTCFSMYLDPNKNSLGECIWCWYDRIFRRVSYEPVRKKHAQN